MAKNKDSLSANHRENVTAVGEDSPTDLEKSHFSNQNYSLTSRYFQSIIIEV